MDGTVIWLGLVIVLVLTLSSTAAFALRVPTRSKLADAFDQAGRTAQWETFLLRLPQLVLAMAAVRAMCGLALLLVVLHATENATGEMSDLANLIALFITTVIVLVLGISVPTAWAKYSGEWLISTTLPLLYAAWAVSLPIVWVMQLVDPIVRRLAGVPPEHERDHEEELEQEVLDAVEEMSRQGAVDAEEREMIESVIELRDTPVEHIMVPRTEMIAIPRNIDLAGVKQVVKERGHSRIPVYDETIDTILGVLYAKDLLQLKEGAPLDATKTMRKALFIPESKNVKDLLHEFQEQKVHIAIVLDEYGGTAGLVTIEDILEELVGDIFDEYENPALDEIKRIDEHTVEVDARTRVDDLNDELSINLPEDEDYETIGGLVFSALGKIPKVGESCEHSSDQETVALQVIDAEARRVLKIRLQITPKNHNGNGQA